MKKSKLSWLKYLVLPAIIGVVLIFYFIQQHEEDVKKDEILLPVRVINAEYGVLQQSIELSGQIESEKMVTILPRVAGLLEELYVDIGDPVEVGQIIGKVDSQTYDLQLKQAESAYLAAKSTFERTEKLYQSNATTQQNFDQAKGQYEAYKSQYELARLQYDYTTLESPIDGVVLQRHATVGELVASQIPIVTIGDISNPILRAKIPETYYRRFASSPELIEITIFRPDDPGLVYNAEITATAPYVSAESRNFEVLCEINDETSNLRPGMFVYANFVLAESDPVYSLPVDVMMSDGSLWYINDKSHAVRLELDASTFVTQKRFSIPVEWKDYNFVVEGQYFLREGVAVKIMGSIE